MQALSCSSCAGSDRDSEYLRATRRTSTPARSRSCRSAAADGSGGSSRASRRVLTNSPGSASTRSRTARPLSRQLRYSSPTSRVDSPSGAIARASRSQPDLVARAMGTRCFIAACAPIRPRRTSSWTATGSSPTSASRRDTQLGLRSKRSASSSCPSPKLDCSSDRSHPCSSADSASADRSDRARSSADSSSSSHAVAQAVSRPRRFSARTRLYPSTTTKRSPVTPATTTIGACCPCAASDDSTCRSFAGRLTRSRS